MIASTDPPRPEPLPRTITIAGATAGDLGAVASLAGRIWRRHYPGIITDAQIDYMLERGYSLERLGEQISTPGHWLDVIKVDGELAGLANYYLTGVPGEMKLDKLYLAQEHHGRGLGTRLLEHVAAVAREQNCRRLVLNVNKHNTSSIRVYERNGFRVRDSVVADIGNGFVMDDYVMEKELGGIA